MSNNNKLRSLIPIWMINLESFSLFYFSYAANERVKQRERDWRRLKRKNKRDIHTEISRDRKGGESERRETREREEKVSLAMVLLCCQIVYVCKSTDFEKIAYLCGTEFWINFILYTTSAKHGAKCTYFSIGVDLHKSIKICHKTLYVDLKIEWVAWLLELENEKQDDEKNNRRESIETGETTVTGKVEMRIVFGT